MNTARICVITLCVAVGAGSYLSLRAPSIDAAQLAQGTAASTRIAARNQEVGRGARHAPDVHATHTVSGPAFEADASDLRPPSQTLNHVVDALNAGIGPEGEYVDPEALAAVLRSDPELGRLLNE